ncbi:hypothetical protein EYM_06550 [Ignicoccus islandicus DSM 13165]|uniref:YdbS-like PH domain-containing protein n=1 Tax=Ignicoccus islandicus DSM 13165 TaxID=940295 RepID=A0A0U3DYP1_9CREN|nr:PH domain-containing protein [Ignicoccus islandicus]ALU12698.1 hypothetical protein EYM_06550 [Ignicoccus islandicus DSM 13165]
MEVVIKPTLRAYFSEILMLILSAIAILAAPLVPESYRSYWYALPIAVIALSYFVSKRAFVLTLISLLPSMILFYLYGPLYAALALIVVAVEFYMLVIYVRSMKYVLSDEGLTISVEFPLYSKVRSIPKNVIGEVTVATDALGKLMGYSEIIIKLRNGEEVKIEAAPKELAEKVKELIT